MQIISYKVFPGGLTYKVQCNCGYVIKNVKTHEMVTCPQCGNTQHTAAMYDKLSGQTSTLSMVC